MPRRIPVMKLNTDGTPARPRPADCRPTRTQRGYGPAWQRTRLWKLAHDPECQDCGAPATEVDHVLALSRGGTHDPENLRSLCGPCHSRKTCAVDGGLGRRPAGG